MKINRDRFWWFWKVVYLLRWKKYVFRNGKQATWRAAWAMAGYVWHSHKARME